MYAKVRKAVITAAGLGTRLLPYTKELPKEMLPLFSKCSKNNTCLKPVLQMIFEQLYDHGIREYCFIVGRGKRAIEDFFTRDSGFLKYLYSKNKHVLAEELKEFYRKVESSVITFINQPEPRGFGEAVYRARFFVGDEPFIVHAGDDLVLSENISHIKRLIKVFEGMGADAVLLVEKVVDPRKYGVIEGVEVSSGIYRVVDIVEKPKIPPSNIATIAVYVFSASIFKAIKCVQPDPSGEIQLTDAIRILLSKGYPVYAVKLLPGEKRLDVGTPESYWEALKITYERCLR